MKAAIHTLGGFSAHASQTQLIEWLGHFEGEKPRLFLVHGEENAKQALATVATTHGWRPHIARLGEKVKF